MSRWLGQPTRRLPPLLPSTTQPVSDPQFLPSTTHPVSDPALLPSTTQPVSNPQLLPSTTQPVFDPPARPSNLLVKSYNDHASTRVLPFRDDNTLFSPHGNNSYYPKLLHLIDVQPTQNSSGTSRADRSLIPLPDFSVAIREWGLCWDFHTYGFSLLFLLLTVLSIGVFLRYRLLLHLRLRLAYNTLILVAATGMARAIFLLLDPYGYKENLAELLVGLMTQAAYPLLCSGFGLTQVLVFRMARADVGRSRWRSLSFLLGCALGYLFLVVVVETLVVFQRRLKFLLLLDTGCFILWSLALVISFICSGFRFFQSVSDNKTADDSVEAADTNRRLSTALVHSATNETNISVFSVHLPTIAPFQPSPLPDTPINSPVVQITNRDSLTPLSTFPNLPVTLSSEQSSQNVHALDHRKDSVRRLSWLKRKKSPRDRMIIVMATEEDGNSTSSTDVERTSAETIQKRKRPRKRTKHRQALLQNHGGSQHLSPVPSVVHNESKRRRSSLTKELLSLIRRKHKIPSKEDKALTDTALDKTGGASNQNKPSPSASSILNSNEQVDPSVLTDISRASNETTSELPLLNSHLGQFRKKAIQKFCEMSSLDSNEDTLKNSQSVLGDVSDRSVCELQVMEAEIEQITSGQSVIPSSTQNLLNTNIRCVPTEPSSKSSSQGQANGYAEPVNHDTPTSSLGRVSPACSEPQTRLEAPCPPSPAHSVGGTSTSSHESDRQSVISDPSDPRQVERVKLAQRAVYLTYVLAGLFAFACLLQLYTMFSVYGLLGTIPRPDPWPWLTFQSIFRLTEASICLITTLICYLVLLHRHQRFQQQQQQQQQGQEPEQFDQLSVDLAEDCTV